jgi:hypothetical protein
VIFLHSSFIGKKNNNKDDEQVKNCWEMQQCDCHGEKKRKNTKKTSYKYNVKVSPNSIEFN